MKIQFVLLLSVLSAGLAFAGADATFTGAFDTLEAWSSGSLGKTISAAMFVTGMGWAVYKGSVLTAVLDIAAVVSFNMFPTVMGFFITATV